jgi:DNA-binding IclR family transcriptional regulator
MTTLQSLGLVRKENGLYQLGIRFITISEYVRNELDIYSAGREEIGLLAKRTGDHAHLVIESNGFMVVIYETCGEHAVATDYHLRMRETHQQLHQSAAGKSILAHLPDDRAEKILSDLNFVPKTENTITSLENLRNELEAVREQGYSINDEEEVGGIRSVGAPIQNYNEEVVGAVSMSATTSRLQDERFEEVVPEMVMETANIIEVNLEAIQFNQNKRADSAQPW